MSERASLDPRIARRLHGVALVGSILAQAIAAVGLFGSIYGRPGLARWQHDGTAIDPIVALALICAGVTLWPRSLRRSIPLPKRVRMTLAGLVLCAGLVCLATAIGRMVPGVMPLIVERHSALVSTDRMTLNAALALLLLGVVVAISLGHSSRRRITTHALLLLFILFLMSGLAGHTMRTTTHEALGWAAPISIPAAISGLLLAISLMVGRSDRGLIPLLTGTGQGSVLARRLLPFTAVMPALLCWLLLTNGSMGGYRREFATVLLAISSGVFFFGLVWWYASFVERAEARDRRSDEALRSSEAFYHSLVEGLPQSILRKGIDGRFTFGNGKVLEAMGLRLEDLVGKTDFDFYPAELAEKYRRDDEHVLATGETLDTIEAHVEAGGDLRYVQVIKTPLRNHEDRIVGVQCFFWDVTSRKIAEEKLQSQNTLLSEMARSERAAHEARKHAQAQLVQSAKLAGLGEMVAGVAHEINNPLSFVGNNVAVLERDLAEVRALIALYADCEPILAQSVPERHQRIRDFREATETEYTLANLDGLLSRTREGVRRIQQIVKDLRVFARLDESDIAEYDLNDSIQSTITIIMGNAKRKHVTIEQQLAPLPTATGYATKLNQVVMNLIGNAIDACDEGGKVVLRTFAEDNGEGLRLEVEDNGCGIDPAVVGRIFDPFFTTKPVGIGTGLGLSISYGIVQDHGGTIEVEPAPPRGTRFVVRLPLRFRPAPRPTASRSAPVAVDTPRIPEESTP